MAERTYVRLTKQEEPMAEGLAQRYMANAKRQVIAARPELRGHEEQAPGHRSGLRRFQLRGVDSAQGCARDGLQYPAWKRYADWVSEVVGEWDLAADEV